jgi:hypothetical protein
MINRYISAGVHRNKIVISLFPSICIWSLSRKCLVNENEIESMELITNNNDDIRLSFENNRLISMQNRTEINITEINNSNGIIISNATYGKPYFRFGFIPTK